MEKRESLSWLGLRRIEIKTHFLNSTGASLFTCAGWQAHRHSTIHAEAYVGTLEICCCQDDQFSQELHVYTPTQRF